MFLFFFYQLSIFFIILLHTLLHFKPLCFFTLKFIFIAFVVNSFFLFEKHRLSLCYSIINVNGTFPVACNFPFKVCKTVYILKFDIVYDYNQCLIGICYKPETLFLSYSFSCYSFVLIFYLYFVVLSVLLIGCLMSFVQKRSICFNIPFTLIPPILSYLGSLDAPSKLNNVGDKLYLGILVLCFSYASFFLILQFFH